jgi:5-methyltetrahydrofolate--homocysteine methyltransferase
MNEPMRSLVDAILAGDHERSRAIGIELRNKGFSVEDIVRLGIQPSMDALDNKCTVEQFNLLEIMLSGRAVSAVTRELFPNPSSPPDPKATIVVASLEGDIHDIGKNILKMVLIGHRYKVVDCGKNVPLETVLAAVKEADAQALCISGLITSVIPGVRTLRSRLNAMGLEDVRLLAGGAALKQSNAELLKVDFIGQTAFDGAAYLNGFWGDAK